ncbi:hypothetical protein N9T07_01795, partial [bacterium]|nr:hypothetical protein [bacterium]
MFAFTQSFTAQAQDLTLQGVLDLNITDNSYGVNGSQGKAIHVKATAAIADLSIYGIGVANNGGGTDGQEYTFPVMSVSNGDDILVARSIQAMTDYLVGGIGEFEHVLLGSSAISQNGNDAIELFMNSTVVETFGDVNVNPDTYGSGCGTDPTCWDYEDSWAYRTSPNTLSTFVIGEWNIADVNCTDGGTTIYDNSCLYPICPPPPVTYTVTMTDSWGDGWDGASWTATSTSSGTVFGPYTVSYSQGTTNTESFTTSESCFTFVVGGGSYASEHTWTLDSAGVQIDAGGDPYSGSFGACTYGCTDVAFDNYDASADFDDGSCADTYTLI